MLGKLSGSLCASTIGGSLMDKRLELFDKLVMAEKYFTRKYADTVELAKELFERNQLDLCEKQLNRLPSSGDLLEKLVSKLKDKHLYKTLRKIEEGKVGNDLLTLKGLLSLGTHIVIECEHGNDEYRILLPNLLEKISEMIYTL
jgi:hypothetical protein